MEGRDMNVLVYGTLRRGLGNNRGYLAGSRYVGTLTVDGLACYEYCDRFPMAIMKNGEKTVCEMYEVSEKTLARLDRLEGHPGFYTRVEIDVSHPNTPSTRAFVYVGTLDQVCGMLHIRHGDWVKAYGRETGRCRRLSR